MARKKKHPEHVNNERWLVSYADFITLLFAFFTTLYAISTIDQRKAGKLMFSMMTALHLDFFPMNQQSSGGPPQPVERPMLIDRVVRFVLGGNNQSGRRPNYGRVAAELLAMAQKPELNGRVQIRLEARGVVVSLAEAGFFDTGSAELKPEGLPAVAAIAEKILEWSGLEVLVEGHTDNVPIRPGGRYRSNWELSTGRAVTVLHLLIEKHRVDPLRLSAAGYGEYRPVSPNDTAEGRSRNRRVDIVLRAPGLTDEGAAKSGESPAPTPSTSTKPAEPARTPAPAEPAHAPAPAPAGAAPTHAGAAPARAAAKPVHTPAAPVHTPAEPVHTPAEPAHTPAEPVHAPAEPAHAPAEPAHAPAEPAHAPAHEED